MDGSEDTEEEKLTNRFTLSDIEIKDSVPFVRQVVSGLVLDVPFYLSHHKQKYVKSISSSSLLRLIGFWFRMIRAVVVGPSYFSLADDFAEPYPACSERC